MKRYVIEMANSLEKQFPGKAAKITRIRNDYIAGMIAEIDAVEAMIREIRSL